MYKVAGLFLHYFLFLAQEVLGEKIKGDVTMVRWGF